MSNAMGSLHALALIKTNKWLKAALLTSPLKPPFKEFAGPDPLDPIDMGEWIDPLVEVASSINLFPREETTSIDAVKYHLTIMTPRLHGTIHITSPFNPDFVELEMSLIKVGWAVANAYDDDEMREYVEKWEEDHQLKYRTR